MRLSQQMQSWPKEHHFSEFAKSAAQHVTPSGRSGPEPHERLWPPSRFAPLLNTETSNQGALNTVFFGVVNRSHHGDQHCSLALARDQSGAGRMRAGRGRLFSQLHRMSHRLDIMFP
jgi:hypothetical protein